MADQSNGAGSSSSTPKVVPSLAKRADTTRGGAARLKFVPTLPARRVKGDAKKEDAPAASAAAAPAERGRGRGRGFDRGRGRGRADPRPPAVEMIASGPFAMGPALAGTSARRTAPRTTMAPVPPPGGGPKLGAGLTPVVKREKMDEDEDERAVYSDPDEGVEIVDMEDVKGMDWMAPESLAREKVRRKKGKGKEVRVKEEEVVVDLKGKGVTRTTPMNVDTPEPQEKVNAANALDLSDSEEEEELEDIIDDFAAAQDTDEGPDLRHDRLYFFQFPKPFPQFISPSTQQTPAAADGVKEDEGGKKVTFAQDTKPPAPDAAAKGKEKEKEGEKTEPKVDGVIGQLEIYESGAVKMRLGNGIVMDVTAATQPSFLQQAVYVDPESKRLCVLGEVNRRFMVSPNIDSLLQSMELNESRQNQLDGLGDDLIVMDTS